MPTTFSLADVIGVKNFLQSIAIILLRKDAENTSDSDENSQHPNPENEECDDSLAKAEASKKIDEMQQTTGREE